MTDLHRPPHQCLLTVPTHSYFSASLDSSPQTLTSIPASLHLSLGGMGYLSLGGMGYLSRTIAFPGKPGFGRGSQSWVRGWSWQVHSG